MEKITSISFSGPILPGCCWLLRSLVMMFINKRALMVTKQDGRPSVSPRLLLSSPRTRHPAQHRADPTLRSPGEMVTITDTEAKPSISYYCSNGLNIQNRQIIWLCCSFKTFWLLFSNNISMLVWVITVTVCCSQQLVGVRGGLGCWGAGVDDDSIILQPPAAVTSSNK